MVGAGGNQKPVNKTRRCAGHRNSNQHNGLVKVGGHNMLGRSVFGGLTDDIILARIYLCNNAGDLIFFGFNFYMVANGNGVGRAPLLQTKFSFYPALHVLVIFSTNGVPAAC